MSLLRDHCIFEITVRYTKTIVLREGQDMDYVGEEKYPNTVVTLRLIANRFYDQTENGIVEGWVRNYFRYQKEQDFEILSIDKRDINGVLIEG